MGDIVKLAHSQETASKRSCTTCRHFHPDTKNYGWNRTACWPFGKRTGPSTEALLWAMCSATGGLYACIARNRVCRGDYWEPPKE